MQPPMSMLTLTGTQHRGGAYESPLQPLTILPRPCSILLDMCCHAQGMCFST